MSANTQTLDGVDKAARNCFVCCGSRSSHVIIPHQAADTRPNNGPRWKIKFLLKVNTSIRGMFIINVEKSHREYIEDVGIWQSSVFMLFFLCRLHIPPAPCEFPLRALISFNSPRSCSYAKLCVSIACNTPMWTGILSKVSCVCLGLATCLPLAMYYISKTNAYWCKKTA